jgi:hypothetical protein
MITISAALEAATLQIVQSMGLLEVDVESMNVYDLPDGQVALIVLENQLILGEINHKTAHMDTFEVLNVTVAGEQVRSRTYFYDRSPSVEAASLYPEAVFVRV